MPRKPVDYSKAIIYKLCCKDVSITECYVGSTTDFRKRKNQHKQTSKSSNIYVYQFIRENGDWENWEMILLEKSPCNDKLELLAKEREWKEKLNSKLNTHNPIRYEEDNYCEHNKIKSECKECGSFRFCEHNRVKSRCKECGGSQICEHNKRRTYCKECKGSAFCEHNRVKFTCKECGGSQICEHNKRKHRCKECKININQ